MHHAVLTWLLNSALALTSTPNPVGKPWPPGLVGRNMLAHSQTHVHGYLTHV